ncbi:MAG: hypothetical protein FWH17_07925 [Oscillospiraceae bacterium]|nr:hypothetical protein [Oscillospiraceae bacterium]
MTPGPYLVYKCPKCGKFSFRGSLRSGNTIGAELFSDGKRIAPMLPEFPSITKCKNCKLFYWLKSENKIGEFYRHEADKKWNDAYKAEFLTVNEYDEAINSKVYTNEKEKIFLRTKLWQAMHDKIRWRENFDIPEDDKELYEKNCKALIEILNINEIEGKIMIAELNRNLGKFIECKNILETINNDKYIWIKKILEIECNKSNQKVISLIQ